MNMKLLKEMERTVIGEVFHDPDRFKGRHSLKELVSDAIMKRDMIFLYLYDKAEAGKLTEDDHTLFNFWLTNGPCDVNNHSNLYKTNKEELAEAIKPLVKEWLKDSTKPTRGKTVPLTDSP